MVLRIYHKIQNENLHITVQVRYDKKEWININLSA